VHSLAVHLAPVLAAEKSKTAYYIAGGLLVAWALIVSLLFGLRKPDFPGNLGGQRIVMAISAVLVIAAAATAVVTSGSPEAKGEGASLASQSTAAQAKEAADKAATSSPGSSPVKEGSSAPAGTGPTSGKPSAGKAGTPSKSGKSAPAKAPKATTGTPAPASSPAAATMLKLAANPAGQLAYEPKQLSAKAGKVTIDFANASPIEHDVAVAQGSSTLGQTPVFAGGTKTLALSLKPGTYKFFCTVPGHRQAGMEGTLTVS
jgi:plastocyanin